MGLIRVTGGNNGIKEYLENGQKEGRSFSRDELDERVVLDGDLELTNAVIQSIDSDGERYLHLTFSLKEDEIPEETLKAIAADIKAFVFAAYRPDEFTFYAEAHLPKIKSYANSKDGSLVERKPHLHIVIPKVNLLSGQLLDPLGKETQQEKFIDALQEHINNKHGLASPKDNRRVIFTGESDMIARYKGDLFTGQNAALRESILASMLERDIRDYDTFRALVAEHGETHSRNAGKSTEYLNVKPAEAAKGVNLKDYVFTREFVELPQADKLRRLSADIQRKYETSDAARRDPEHIAATLREWHEIRAREVKYINSGNRKFFAAYKAASREEKLQILADRESRFYAKHDYDQEIHHDDAGRARAYIDQHLERITDNLGAASRHILAARRAAGNLDRAAGKLAHRRAGRAVAAAIQGYGRNQGHPENPRFRERRRPVDNVVGQRQADAGERANRASAETLSEFADIRKNMDARRFLTHVAISHGVIADKYEIVKAKDGSDRIRCGKRNLNVSDFLTQELNLSFAEAAPILREAYAAQLTDQHAHARAAPTKSMWQDYRAWKDAHYQARGADWTAQRASEATRRAAIKQKFQRQKSDLYAQGGLSRAERRAALSVARMERVQADQALRAQIDIERATLKARYALKPLELYRVYLQELAQAGDSRALAELRRQRVEPSVKPAKAEPHITASTPGATPHHEAEPLLRDLSYIVATNGDVTYQFQGRDVIRDEATSVRVLDADKAVAETALRLAIQKFGPTLTVNGSDEFRRQIVEIAIENHMRIEFRDPALNALRERLEKEKAPTAPKAAEAKTQPTPQPQPETTKEKPPMEASRYTEGRGRRRTDAERLEEERQFMEAVERAKACDLPELLRARGVDIKKNGAKEYKIDNGPGQEADRLFPSKRDGHWMAYVPGGDRQYMDAIDYLRRHTGEGYRETVLKLAGAMNGSPNQVIKVAQDSRAAGKRENKVETRIMLGTANDEQKARIYRYAHDERGITHETLAEAVKQGVIAADDPVARRPDGKRVNLGAGLTFIGRDEHGNIRNAETRFLHAIKIDGEDVNKRCYKGTDKTYPPILRGDDKNVHLVEGGMDGLALWDMHLREGKEPPTTIITGGARTLKWEDNPQIQQLIQGAEYVRPWEDNELDKTGKPDLKKRLDTTAAHDNQVAAIVRLRGTADGVERMRPPEGIKDIAAWNKIAAEHYQVQQRELQQQEHEESASPRPGR